MGITTFYKVSRFQVLLSAQVLFEPLSPWLAFLRPPSLASGRSTGGFPLDRERCLLAPGTATLCNIIVLLCSLSLSLRILWTTLVTYSCYQLGRVGIIPNYLHHEYCFPFPRGNRKFSHILVFDVRDLSYRISSMWRVFTVCVLSLPTNAPAIFQMFFGMVGWPAGSLAGERDAACGSLDPGPDWPCSQPRHGGAAVWSYPH